MARLRVATTIAAPPARVWDDLRSIVSHREWMADAVAIRFTSPQVEGVGTTFECDTKVGPFRLTDRMEITAWEPERRMGVRHTGLVTGTGDFRLRRVRGDRTRFLWEERLRFPWWLGGPVTAWLAVPVLRRVWRRSMRRLAARFA